MADQTIITPTTNGPYHVRGSFRIVLPSGRELETDGETWLCRCGGSGNKPFCDGTHKKIGFQAGEPAVASAASDGQAGAPSADGDFLEVAEASAIREGQLLGVEVDGQPVVIGRVGGELYAIGGICTHQYARLAEGELEGETVTCPLHNSGFNIRTGQAVRLPAVEAVPCYAVRVEGGRVLVARQPAARRQG